MRRSFKDILFVGQWRENAFGILKFSAGPRRKITGLEIGLSAEKGERLSVLFPQAFKKLGYNHNSLVMALPRQQATCRLLRVPARDPLEIERILALQAPHYLPYAPQELVTGYHVISTDKEGYSDVYLVIVPREAVEGYLSFCHKFRPRHFAVVLSSYGLSSLFYSLRPGEKDVVLILDSGATWTEVVVVSGGTLLFSRSFKAVLSDALGEDTLLAEIIKTKEAYLKEGAGRHREPIKKIILMSWREENDRFVEILSRGLGMSVENLVCGDPRQGGLLPAKAEKVLASGISPAVLCGFGVSDLPESVSLLPQELKNKARGEERRREWGRRAVVVAALVFIWAAGVAQSFQNKSLYLERLRSEADVMSREAKPLEEIEKRLRFLRKEGRQRIRVFDLLFELHQVLPSRVVLSHMAYEEDKEVILRGQVPELGLVSDVVGRIEKSAGFHGFTVKLKYASQRKTAGGAVDFEIVCTRKK